ncbi:hypothetical protein BN7874_014 [Phage NCTB]|nr:hypothetical protein BN7874_014 [Phage NCTB]
MKKTKKKLAGVPMHDGYRYIPAAVTLDQYNISIYIRYRKSKYPNDIIIKQRTLSYTWLICPDRELVIVGHSFMDTAFHPNDFDECIHFDMFNQEHVHQLGLNYVMNNFYHDSNDRSAAESRAKGNMYPHRDDRRVTVVGDSGGFQYVSGQAEYVNPKELGQWYAKNVDAGMQLDIPLTITLPKKEFKQFAQLQNRTTDMILANTSSHVELFNVIHGKSLDQRKLYREIVESKHGNMNRMALGGMRSHGPLGMADILTDICYSGKRYGQYHLLGLTSSVVFPVLIAMSSMGDNPPHITSDSASHKLAAKSRNLYRQYEMGKLRAFDIGEKIYSIPGIKNRSFNGFTNRELDCTCPVCSALKYADILTLLTGQHIVTLTSIHNMYETSKYVKLVREIFENESYEDYVQFIKSSHATNRSTDSKDLVQALDFLLEFHEKGIDKARAKHRANIARSADLYSSSEQTDAIYSTGNNSVKADEFAEEDLPVVTDKAAEYDRLMGLYNKSKENLALLEKGKTVKNSGNKKAAGAVAGW